MPTLRNRSIDPPAESQSPAPTRSEVNHLSLLAAPPEVQRSSNFEPLEIISCRDLINPSSHVYQWLTTALQLHQREHTVPIPVPAHERSTETLCTGYLQSPKPRTPRLARRHANITTSPTTAPSAQSSPAPTRSPSPLPSPASPGSPGSPAPLASEEPPPDSDNDHSEVPDMVALPTQAPMATHNTAFDRPSGFGGTDYAATQGSDDHVTMQFSKYGIPPAAPDCRGIRLGQKGSNVFGSQPLRNPRGLQPARVLGPTLEAPRARTIREGIDLAHNSQPEISQEWHTNQHASSSCGEDLAGVPSRVSNQTLLEQQDFNLVTSFDELVYENEVNFGLLAWIANDPCSPHTAHTDDLWRLCPVSLCRDDTGTLELVQSRFVMIKYAALPQVGCKFVFEFIPLTSLIRSPPLSQLNASDIRHIASFLAKPMHLHIGPPLSEPLPFYVSGYNKVSHTLVPSLLECEERRLQVLTDYGWRSGCVQRVTHDSFGSRVTFIDLCGGSFDVPLLTIRDDPLLNRPYLLVKDYEQRVQGWGFFSKGGYHSQWTFDRMVLLPTHIWKHKQVTHALHYSGEAPFESQNTWYFAGTGTEVLHALLVQQDVNALSPNVHKISSLIKDSWIQDNVVQLARSEYDPNFHVVLPHRTPHHPRDRAARDSCLLQLTQPASRHDQFHTRQNILTAPPMAPSIRQQSPASAYSSSAKSLHSVGPPAPFPCVREGCPCVSYTGQEGEFCSNTCRASHGCNYARHSSPSEPTGVFAKRRPPARTLQLEPSTVTKCAREPDPRWTRAAMTSGDWPKQVNGETVLWPTADPRFCEDTKYQMLCEAVTNQVPTAAQIAAGVPNDGVELRPGAPDIAGIRYKTALSTPAESCAAEAGDSTFSVDPDDSSGEGEHPQRGTPPARARSSSSAASVSPKRSARLSTPSAKRAKKGAVDYISLYPFPAEPTKFELGLRKLPNAFFFADSSTKWERIHIPADTLEAGPFKGSFTAYYCKSGRQLKWGADIRIIRPYEEMRDFHASALAVKSKDERAKLSKIARAAQSNAAAPTEVAHRSGHRMPTEGWPVAVTEHVIHQMKVQHTAAVQAGCAFDPWSDKHEQDVHRMLRERDFTNFKNDIIDVALTEALEAGYDKAQSKSTRESLMKILQKVNIRYPHASPERVINYFITTVNLQEGRSNPRLTHAVTCTYYALGICLRSHKDAAKATPCLVQLTHGTLKSYLSHLGSHPLLSTELAAAIKSRTVQSRVAKIARHQAKCGRVVEGCDPLFREETDTILTWMYEFLASLPAGTPQEMLTVLLWSTCIAWLATVRDFARRGAECLRLRKDACHMFETRSKSLVFCIEVHERKVLKSDPRALAHVIPSDQLSAARAITALYRKFDEFGLDPESPFLFPRLVHRNGALTVDPGTLENPNTGYTASQFQPLLTKAAKACHIVKKVTVKSLRSMNAMLGASAGLSQPQVNKIMSWSSTSTQAKSYSKMVRALAKPPASVSADQLKALQHAECYDVATFATGGLDGWI